MNQQRLNFVALSVANLDRSFHYYQSLLGAPLARANHDAELNDPWYGGEHAAHSWTDGAFLHFAIYPSREPQRPVTQACQIGFAVEEFEQTHDRMVQAGVTVVQPPRAEPWGRTARYLDPDGNIVSITASAS